MWITDAQAMEALGASFAGGTRSYLGCPPRACDAPREGAAVVFLSGALGAGKTTLARGLLRALGVDGRVKSPTYTLLEPYSTSAGAVYHFDLYRLGDPEELEYLGAREYFGEHALCLVEWPERGRGGLPDPDVALQLDVAPGGREVQIRAFTDRGRKLVAPE